MSERTRLSPFLDRVFNEDVLNLLERLPDRSVDCIYADPDYNVGVKYNDTSYTRKFEDYINWCIEWSKESHRVLKDDGNFFIINYPKNNAYLRTGFLDNSFYDVNEYVWIYRTNIGHSKRRFTTAHRSILHCTKSKNNKFYKENVAQPYENPTDRRIKKLISSGKNGRMPYSWLYYDLVKNVGFSKTFHACQIPEDLSRTLIEASTKKKDVVLVLFGGSGSEIAECMKSGRHYVSAEIDRKYYDLILERIKAGGVVPKKYRLMSSIKKNKSPNTSGLP
ncbi:MAG: site-specific DNA-methyltransferase [Nitrososphaerota archaeon]|nr:site-specific DNA-methyltransferase [Nitrososphaerota archaeon]